MNRLVTVLAFLVSVVSFSQNTQNDSTKTVKKDTVVPLKYNFKNNQNGALFLSNHSQKVVTYDKVLNKFMIVEKVGD